MKQIRSKRELNEVARELGVRDDWHEPDEQGVRAHVDGRSFDNAGYWPRSEVSDLPDPAIEMHVILTRDGKPVACVNLATLFAMACGTHE